MSSSFSSASTKFTGNVFEDGIYKTILLRIENSKTTTTFQGPLPPKPLIIVTPKEAGEFPVVIFLHGYLLNNSFYSQLMEHVASHGFILIAPQLYSIAGSDVSDEIKATGDITNWLSTGLSNILPPRVIPNLTRLALAGHSRGGKTAFALALQKPTTASLKFSALIGIDPVDGMDTGKQTPPPVLTYKPNSFDLNGSPVMVIGSGLGEIKKNILFPACAPKGVNHEQFFKECREPACYFVVKDYGHLDMLDDETKGIRGRFTYCLCKNGKCRKPMRRFVGGISVAFLRASLCSDDSVLAGIRDGVDAGVPVELQNVKFLM